MSLIKFRAAVLAALFCCSLTAVGQENVVLEGYVTDEDQNNLAGAKVRVEPGAHEQFTDENGEFRFEIMEGIYTLTVIEPGMDDYILSDILLEPGEETFKHVTMTEDAPTQEEINDALVGAEDVDDKVTVLGMQTQLSEDATLGEREARNVVDKLDIQDLERSGDSDVGSAVKRVAGVTVVDGKYAVIRGLKGRYTSSALNGVSMPSTDPIQREIQLDLFPANILGGIDVQKTFTANLPGDTTGGHIGIQTLEPGENFQKLSVKIGHVEDVSDGDVLSYEGSAQDASSELIDITDGGLNVQRCVVADQTDCITGEQRTTLGQSLPNIYTPSFESAKPDIGIGYGLGKSFDLGKVPLSLYGALSYETKTRSRLDGTLSSTEVLGTYQRSSVKEDLDAYFAASIELRDADKISSKTLLFRKEEDVARDDTGLDRNEDNSFRQLILQYTERELLAQQFMGEHFDLIPGVEDELTWNITTATTKVDEPDRRTYQILNDRPNFSTLERRYYDHEEDNDSYAIDYKIPFNFNENISTHFLLGLSDVSREREVNQYRFGFRPDSSLTIPPNTIMEQVITDERLENEDIFLTGRTANTDSFNAINDVQALYLSTETNIGDEFTFVAGVRQEDFEQLLRFPNSDVEEEVLEDDSLLPALNFTWRASEDLQLRLGASQTVSYPGIVERAPSRMFDPRTDLLIIGNPNLVVAEIDNLDARIEYYYNDGDSFSIAVFQKKFDNPIERVSADASGSANQGITYRNAKSADLTGMEIDFRATFLRLDNHEAYFSGNYTNLDSSVSLDEVSERLEIREGQSRSLQGLSENIFNFQLGYDHFPSRQKLTLVMNMFDDRIDRVRNTIVGDVFENGRTEININYEKAFNDIFTFSAKLKNITDEAVEYSQKGGVIERYTQGREASISLSAKF